MTTEYGTGDFEKDMADVVELCGTWWNDSLFYKLYNIPFNVDTTWFRIIKEHGLIYTCGRQDGKLVSCYVGLKTPYMFNPSVMTANEIVWCVHKDYRNYRKLIGLMKAIEDLMEKNDIKLWNLAVSNEEKYLPTAEFLERQGYNFMDRCYPKYQGEKKWLNLPQ